MQSLQGSGLVGQNEMLRGVNSCRGSCIGEMGRLLLSCQGEWIISLQFERLKILSELATFLGFPKGARLFNMLCICFYW